MDDDRALMIIITIILFSAIFGGCYAWYSIQPPPPPTPYNELELYQDFNARMKITGNIIMWDNADEIGVPYFKTVFIRNPNDFNVSMDLFWEVIPASMTSFCEWDSSLSDKSTLTPGVNECTLTLMIYDYFDQLEVITQIKARPPK